MQKVTLLILAAGMGSRYGSLKQMDGMGPSGEAILDYSVYDAIRAGFDRVVFVIRESFSQEFKEIFNEKRFGGRIRVDYVNQELENLPEGFTVPEGRTKPWGTNHAVMMAKDVIDTPFVVINADDFYGADAFRTIHRYLSESPAGAVGRYCMVGYLVSNTLSDNGTVSRGVCAKDGDDYLVSITERTKIERRNGRIVYIDDNGEHPRRQHYREHEHVRLRPTILRSPRSISRRSYVRTSTTSKPNSSCRSRRIYSFTAAKRA